jgi:hypothetical protein
MRGIAIREHATMVRRARLLTGEDDGVETTTYGTESCVHDVLGAHIVLEQTRLAAARGEKETKFEKVKNRCARKTELGSTRTRPEESNNHW